MVLKLITVNSMAIILSRYLNANPDSQLGQPGIFQGLNVGVVLYRLDRLRSSLSYKFFVSQNGTDYLAHTYGFLETHLGAQVLNFFQNIFKNKT